MNNDEFEMFFAYERNIIRILTKIEFEIFHFEPNRIKRIREIAIGRKYIRLCKTVGWNWQLCEIKRFSSFTVLITFCSLSKTIVCQRYDDSHEMASYSYMMWYKKGTLYYNTFTCFKNSWLKAVKIKCLIRKLPSTF